jgi:hypothetical protein
VHNNRDNNSSCTFAITNTAHALSNYQDKYVLSSDKHDAIEIYPLLGIALSKVESQGRKLLEFIHKTYFIRINEIVIDFVRHREGNYWILNVKGFKPDESITLAREIRQKEEKQLSMTAREELRRNKRKERLCAMTCKMCLFPYKSIEMARSFPSNCCCCTRRHTSEWS